MVQGAFLEWPLAFALHGLCNEKLSPLKFPCAGQNREPDLSIFNKLNLSLDKCFVANTIIGGVVAWILSFVWNSKSNLTFMLVWSTDGFFCLMVAYDYSLFRWIFESGNLASWSCICEAEYRCCENGNVPVARQVSDIWHCPSNYNMFPVNLKCEPVKPKKKGIIGYKLMVTGHRASSEFRHQPTRHQGTALPPTNSPPISQGKIAEVN